MKKPTGSIREFPAAEASRLPPVPGSQGLFLGEGLRVIYKDHSMARG